MTCSKKTKGKNNKFNHRKGPKQYTRYCNKSCSDYVEEGIGSVPSYVTYDARDKPYIECWLTDEYKIRMMKIREQVGIFIKQGQQYPTFLKYFTPHGVSHCQSVENKIYKLIPGKKFALLSEYERFFLIGGAWLHDLGMYAEGFDHYIASAAVLRGDHHLLSEKIIAEKYSLLGVDESEVCIFTLLACYHRKQEKLENCPKRVTIGTTTIRVRLLAAYLRLADALDIDQSRAAAPDYAMALSYGIPFYHKMNWIQSKLVLGVDIDASKSCITVHLRYPKNIMDVFHNIETEREKNAKIKEFNERIERLYTVFIINNLNEELDSLWPVLSEHNVTTYIKIDRQIKHIYFEKKFLKEISIIVSSEMAIRRPSSTALYEVFVDTLIHIFDEYKTACTQKGETGTKASINDYAESSKETLLKFISEMSQVVLKDKRTHFHVVNMLSTFKRILDKTNNDSVENILNRLKSYYKHYYKFAAKSKILDQKSNDCINDYIKLMEKNTGFQTENTLIFLESYARILKLVNENSKVYLRENAGRYFLNLHKNTYTKRIFNAITTELGKQFSKAEEHDDDGANARCISDSGVPLKFGVLLYGYSSSVCEALSGFRDILVDAIIKEMFCKYNNFTFMRFLYNSRGSNILEETVSRCFEIYVCESQPKSVYESSKLRYHDGYEYILALRRRNFSNVILVADATCGTLLTQYYDLKDPHGTSSYFPKINFFMFGGNGFTEKYVYHSAGHLTPILSALQKGRTDSILVVNSLKFLPGRSNHIKMFYSHDSNIPLEKQRFKLIKTNKVLQSYENEEVRSTFFNISLNNYVESMEGSNAQPVDPLVVYPPSEDSIRFSDIDAVITELVYGSVRDIITQHKHPEINSDRIANDPQLNRVYKIGPKMNLDRRSAYPPVRTDELVNGDLGLSDFDGFGLLLSALSTNVEPSPSSAPNNKAKPQKIHPKQPRKQKVRQAKRIQVKKRGDDLL